MNAYKEVLQSFQFNKLLKAFWSYEATTPEEYETLKECRAVVSFILSINLKEL